MKRERIPETDQGIQGEFTVGIYDEMQRNLRDRGWIETNSILNMGITEGHALEIGYGPGYLGLEWLKHTQGTSLTGFDISPDMKKLAERNALAYGFHQRAKYHLGNANCLPFEDNSFNAVFTNGSLHEWENPTSVFVEVWRVLKSGGCYLISDLRRDMNAFARAFLWLGTQPSSMRSGLITSIHAAYTPIELEKLKNQTPLKEGLVKGNLIGITLSGIKK